VARAAVYYEKCLGFQWDWGVEEAEVDALHESWSAGGAQIVARPESKPWNLHEFMARDLDGNLFRVFYDFAWELPDRGGRKDDSAERRDARARL
jgi:hypothetical protein